MKKRISIILLAISPFVFFKSASAQSSGSQPAVYSLTEALRIANTRNLDIQLSNAQLRNAGAGVVGAFGTFLPTVYFSSGYSRQLFQDEFTTINVGGIPQQFRTGNPNNYTMNAGINYTIFNGFSREANYNSAQNSFKVADLSMRQQHLDVAFNIHRQYIDVMRNRQISQIRREDFTAGQKEVEAARARFEAGATAIAPVYAQETELGNRELAIVQAENGVNIAKARLLALMGLEPTENAEFLESSIPTTITDTEIAAFRAEMGSTNAVLAAAFKNRSDVQAAKARIDAAEDNLTVSRSGYFPTVSASTGWTWSNNELNDFDDRGRTFVGINLDVPVFDNFRTNTQIQSAQYLLSQSQIQQQQLEQGIRNEVLTAVLNLDAAEKQLEITQRALRSAEQNFKSAGERYKVGLANITDFILANNQYITAKINRINVVYNYLDAQNQVRYATGVLKTE
ncbi:MAG: TolC family protein [Bacteroidota bacterium]